MAWGRGWQVWVHNPQSAGWRKALLKVHQWVGLTVGLYIILISLTGSAIVFRRDLTRWLMPRDQDFSAGIPFAVKVMEWFVDLHDNLLAGSTGRMVNGIGAIALIILILTGAVLWWPGRTRWWRSLIPPRPSNTRRWVWHLHSALAFWGFILLGGWAITGIYFAFPDTFNALFDALATDDRGFDRPGEDILAAMIRLHFGRFGNLTIRIGWVLIGLLPAVLFITGFLVWWRQRRHDRPAE